MLVNNDQEGAAKGGRVYHNKKGTFMLISRPPQPIECKDKGVFMPFKLAIVLPLLIAVTACSNSPIRPPQTEHLKDNSQGWKVACDGKTLSNCYKKAKRRCPTGFDIISEEQIAGSQIALLNDDRHLLLFKCK